MGLWALGSPFLNLSTIFQMPRGKIVSPGLATLLGFKVNDVVTQSMVLEGVERYVKARASFTIGIWAPLPPSRGEFLPGSRKSL